MSIIKKIFLILPILFVAIMSQLNAEEVKKIGKYKDWESMVVTEASGKVCFAQTKPVKRAPAAIKRKDSRIFVTFRPNENIKDEISITSGHTYKNSTVSAKSGKSKFSFFSQGNFAWLLDENEEKKFIKLMKRATDLMIKGKTKDGAETTDHYSMMGFTKAYNTAKKVCS